MTGSATVIEVCRGCGGRAVHRLCRQRPARAARPCCARARCLTSREIGMLAAVGCAAVEVWRRPRVAIISTGDEIVGAGRADPPRCGLRFERRDPRRCRRGSRRRCSKPLGIGPDDEIVLSRLVDEGLAALRHGDAFRRHLEGCRRSVLPRHRLVR